MGVEGGILLLGVEVKGAKAPYLKIKEVKPVKVLNPYGIKPYTLHPPYKVQVPVLGVEKALELDVVVNRGAYNYYLVADSDRQSSLGIAELLFALQLKQALNAMPEVPPDKAIPLIQDIIRACEEAYEADPTRKKAGNKSSIIL